MNVSNSNSLAGSADEYQLSTDGELNSIRVG
jgi:hypothetical protein